MCEITGVLENSPAKRKGIKPGDGLVSINGNKINDVFDYRFYSGESRLTVVVKRNEKFIAVKIRKGQEEDLGLTFSSYLMDTHHSCKNKCIFCFIDQLPKGMRESLYFKDDDERLSFLFGNYITLTNLSKEEYERIIKMRISPVNISVHTMNRPLRCKMMNNRFAGESLDYLYGFCENGIAVNTQLVLCPGVNDGEELRYSLRELYKLYPLVESIACVPVGLTDHREGLYPLTLYDREGAAQVIDIIDEINSEAEREGKERIAYPSDEFFLLSGREMPGDDYYNGYPQLENGVGMCALLKSEFIEALEKREKFEINRKCTVATGKAAYPLIKELARLAQEKFPGLEVKVIQCENKLFGKNITVSGLLCGRDIYDALQGEELYDEVIIPPNCLKRDEDVFLDDMTKEELEKMLNVKIRQNGPSGEDLLGAILGGE